MRRTIGYAAVLLLTTILFVLDGCTPKIAEGPTPIPVTSPEKAGFPLAGEWAGLAQNGDFAMQVTMDFDDTCDPGSVCARFDLPSIPCSGTYTLVGEHAGVYEFHAGDFKGTCGAGRDFISISTGGSLQYVSQGDYGKTRGVLRHPFPVLYDDDGSPDGTAALMYLLSDPIVDLKGISISYGEAHPRTYIQLIGGQLAEFGITAIPLGEGQDGPLAGTNGFPEWLRQAADAFWGMPIPRKYNPTAPVNSARLMVDVLNSASEPVTIFISGPCTNLAAALRLDPTIKEHIRSVTIMGGAIHVPGNLSDLLPDPTNQVAEWNIWGDPQAAYEVFNSGLEITLVPLDATNQVRVNRTDTATWRAGGKPAVFAADLYDRMMTTNSLDAFAIWDIMTAEIMVRPELCAFTDLSVQVITAEGDTNGQTWVLPGGRSNVHVCLNPAEDAIIRTLDGVLSSSR